MVQRPNTTNDSAATKETISIGMTTLREMAYDDREGVVRERRQENRDQNLVGAISRGEGHREELRLVPHLREDDEHAETL